MRTGAWSNPHLLPYALVEEQQHSAHEKNNTNKNEFVPRESPLLDRRACEQNTFLFTRTIALLLSNASCRNGASQIFASSDPQVRPRDTVAHGHAPQSCCHNGNISDATPTRHLALPWPLPAELLRALAASASRYPASLAATRTTVE